MAILGRRTVFTVGYVAGDTAPWEARAGGFGWSPRADVCETPEALHYEIELPGVREDGMKLSFDGGHLIIEGVRPARPRNSPSRCLQVEIEYGQFRRALPVPRDADTGNIEAHFEAGVLSITVPRLKSIPPQNLKIDVK